MAVLTRVATDAPPFVPEPVTDATAVGSPDLVRAAYLGPVADGPPALPPSLTEPIDD